MKLVSTWKDRRLSRGLSMRVVCEAMGISQGTLSLLERGVTLPKRETLEKACQFYECQPGDLYRVERIKPEKPKKREKEVSSQ